MADSHALREINHARHLSGGHSMHPYFGKIDPALAAAIIENRSAPGAVVLDPFCGSGTVLHESLVLGRSAVGWDSSPLAVMVTAAKVAGIADRERAELVALSESIHAMGTSAGLFRKDVPRIGKVPEMPRATSVVSWFNANALIELAFLREIVLIHGPREMSPAAMLLASTAFSRIITPASNQAGESSYRRVPKPDDAGKVIDMFLASLRAVVKAAEGFTRLVGVSPAERRLVSDPAGGWAADWDGRSAEVRQVDTRAEVRSASLVDLVVTSPPYLYSWDYGLYHKFRFYWMGWDLDQYESGEIGRHLRRKGDDVDRYVADMRSCLRVIDAHLAPGATVALVNAPSVIRGEPVDTNLVLKACGEQIGWRFDALVESLDIPGPHHGMYESLSSRNTSTAGNRGKREHVLLFTSVGAQRPSPPLTDRRVA